MMRKIVKKKLKNAHKTKIASKTRKKREKLRAISAKNQF